MSIHNITGQASEILGSVDAEPVLTPDNRTAIESVGFNNDSPDSEDSKMSAFTAWTAKDFMTRDVLTIPAGATLREAAEIFALYNISGAPVLNERGNLVGMLSESDLVMEAQRYADIPRLAVFGFHLIPGDRLWTAYRHSWAMEVSAVMSTRIVTVDPWTPLIELAKMMSSQDVNRIPVLEDHRIIGIIARADIIRAFSSLPTPELRKEAWRPPHALQSQESLHREFSDDTKTLMTEYEEDKKPEAKPDRGSAVFTSELNGFDIPRTAIPRSPSWVTPGEG